MPVGRLKIDTTGATAYHMAVPGDAMSHATSIIFGKHFDTLIAQQMQSGRYSTGREVVRDALRLFEQQQVATQRLSDAIDEGFASGFTKEIDWNALEKRAKNIKTR